MVGDNIYGAMPLHLLPPPLDLPSSPTIADALTPVPFSSFRPLCKCGCSRGNGFPLCFLERPLASIPSAAKSFGDALLWPNITVVVDRSAKIPLDLSIIVATSHADLILSRRARRQTSALLIGLILLSNVRGDALASSSCLRSESKGLDGVRPVEQEYLAGELMPNMSIPRYEPKRTIIWYAAKQQVLFSC